MRDQFLRRPSHSWIRAQAKKWQSRDLNLSSSAPIHLRAAESGSGKNKPRHFSMLAYSGGQLIIGGFDLPVVVDLAGVMIHKQQIPIFLNHERDAIVGHSESIVNDGESINVHGIISGANEAARQVIDSADLGFPWSSSIGANSTQIDTIEAGDSIELNGRSFEGPIHVASHSTLHEISFVAIGGDEQAAASVAAHLASRGTKMTNFQQWLEAQHYHNLELNEQQLTGLRAIWHQSQDRWVASQIEFHIAKHLSAERTRDKILADLSHASSIEFDDLKAIASGTRKSTKSNSEKVLQAIGLTTPDRKQSAGNIDPARQQTISASKNQESQNPANDPIVLMREAAAAESDRISAIQRIAGDEHIEIRARAIREGWDATKTELEVLRASRPTSPAIHSTSHTLDSRVIEASLTMRAGGLNEKECGRHYDEKVMEAALSRRGRTFGLHALMHATITASGGYYPPGQVDNEFIREVKRADAQIRGRLADIEIQAAGGSSGFSLISTSGILSNVANKTLLSAFEAVDDVLHSIAAARDVSDFKVANSYRLTAHGDFPQVGPTGELQHGSLSEEAFTNQAKTYGQILALTRDDIINDDLAAFTGLARTIGRKAAIKLQKVGFSLLLSNPGSFFAAGNNNFISGAGTDLSISSLTQAEQLFLDQTDANGDPVLITPSILLVPTSLKTVAAQLEADRVVNETTTTNKPKPVSNPHAGKFMPHATPWLNSQSLTGSSSTAWYLFGNPADVAAMEIVYLRGRRVPVIESDDSDFNTLGMQWRGYFDFGVAMQDKRAAVKSAGA